MRPRSFIDTDPIAAKLAAFAQRRKTLRNALSDLVSPPAFAAADVDPQRRGATLSVAEFVALADAAGAVL